MTENGRNFIVQASKDSKIQEAMKAAQVEAMLKVANANGYKLTAEDFAADAKAGQLSEEEMKAVAGGSVCVCPVFGGGGGDLTCACVWGVGAGTPNSGHKGYCACSGGGYGQNND